MYPFDITLRSLIEPVTEVDLVEYSSLLQSSSVYDKNSGVLYGEILNVSELISKILNSPLYALSTKVISE